MRKDDTQTRLSILQKIAQRHKKTPATSHSTVGHQIVAQSWSEPRYYLTAAQLSAKKPAENKGSL